MRPRHHLMIIAALAALSMLPSSAGAWPADFFDGSASGQAVYEDMAIAPEAVRVGTSVYVAYQGSGLDPFVMSFEDSGTVSGSYRVGHNPLADGVDPDDSHGAPSLLHDPVTGDFHVFWGAHNSELKHAVTRTPGDIRTWVETSSVPGHVTYPQVFRDDAGVAHLFFRNDDNSGSTDASGNPVSDRQGWARSVSRDGGRTWETATPVVLATPAQRIYARFEPGAAGVVHGVFTINPKSGIPADRSGLFYAKLDTATGEWRDVSGSVLATAGSSIPAELVTTATPSAFALPVDPREHHNGMTVTDDGSGNPVVVYVAGGISGPGACRYECARWTGSAWVTATIVATDFIMDSGAIELGADGALDAYLTVGAGLSGPANDPYSYRGGNLERWRSTDGGAVWSKVATLGAADPGRGVVFNDPQIVAGHDASGPRVLFGEWDNDAGNFVHKVYLWGPKGFRGRTFFPDLQRLAGADRYGAAVAISREAFPNGADTVVVASGEVFPDALAGASLAQAYHAPILLVKKGSAPGVVTSEIRRLKAKNVIVLGGTGTVSAATRNALTVGSVRTNRRISGPDRYAVAANIASELATIAGAPDTVFVVSGTAWADALSAASVAAVRGYPILLVKPSSIPSATAAALATLSPRRVIVAGGPATVSDSVLRALPSPTRISGADRYAVSAALAEYALDGGPALPATLRTDRIVVASGRVFPDALAGSVLAARAYAPLILTEGGKLSTPANSFLRRRAYRVVRCYVLGGTNTVTPATASAIADALRERQAD